MGSVISNLPERLICCFQPPDLRNSLEFLQCIWQIHLKTKWMVTVIPYGATLDIFQRWFQSFSETFNINMQRPIKQFYFTKEREWIKVAHKSQLSAPPRPCLGSLCSLCPPLLLCLWEVLTLSLARQLPSLSNSPTVSLKIRNTK